MTCPECKFGRHCLGTAEECHCWCVDPPKQEEDDMGRAR